MKSNPSINEKVLPVLPLRDMVIFPNSIAPVFAGRAVSLAALQAMDDSNEILVLTQISPEVNDPKEQDLYQVGVVARVLQRLTQDDGTVKLLLSGLYRVRVLSMDFSKPHISATVESLATIVPDQPLETEAWMKMLNTAVANFVASNPSVDRKSVV